MCEINWGDKRMDQEKEIITDLQKIIKLQDNCFGDCCGYYLRALLEEVIAKWTKKKK